MSTMRTSPVTDALAAVLEGHLDGEMAILGAVVERRDQRRVALGDQRAAHLLRAGQLAVVGIELLVQDQKAADLRGRHLRLVGQRLVQLVHPLGDDLQHLRVRRPAPGSWRRTTLLRSAQLPTEIGSMLMNIVT